MVSPPRPGLVRRLSRDLRRRTASLRALPDFVICGAQKGGTSSLFEWLSRHPCVLPARVKEVHYFDKKSAAGAAVYRAEFPLRAALSATRARHGAAVTGEATPSYLAHPAAAARMRALVPDARLIFLLRDPVDRAYSHYRMSARRGFEPLSFEDALDAEEGRLAGELARIEADAGAFSPALRHHGYALRGRYAAQLERFLAEYPADQMLVLPSEQVFRAPEAAWDRVLAFLGLPPAPLRDAEAVNVGGEAAPLDAGLRDRLRGRFASDNERLFALLEERFGERGFRAWWPAAQDEPEEVA